MTTLTYADTLGRHGIAIPAHLEAQAAIPIITEGIWRQGDVYVARDDTLTPHGTGAPADGVKVVQGDADRNSHILDCPGGTWHPGTYRHEVADYGVIVVPAGETAVLTHTSEHGSVGFAGGTTGATWRIWGQLEFAKELRRAAD